MTMVPDTRFARTAEGLRVAYQAAGSGAHDVVLIQPFQGVDTIWDEPSTAGALERLGRVARMILFDPRGFGSSDAVPLGAMPTPEAWMEDACAVLDEVAAERATFVAMSGAAFIPLLFAATYPRRTAGLVIVDGSARALADDDYSGFTREEWDSLAAWCEEHHGTGAAIAVMAVPSRMKDPAFLGMAGRAERLMNSPATRGALFRWLGDVDVRAALPSIRVPTLIVNHPGSPTFPSEHSKYLAQHIAGARLKELPGVDVAFFTEARDALVDVIEEFVTGAPPVPEDNRVLATVMFADIVGSTDRAAAMGDRKWTELLAQHDARLRATVERYRGRLVKTVGDGAVATFDGPARGIRCAEAVRKSAGELGLELRCGLHTGEVELYGEDIAGLGVHVAARVSAIAEPDEVLVSSTVKDLVVGSGIDFVERGERELKGVPGTWRVYSVERV